MVVVESNDTGFMKYFFAEVTSLKQKERIKENGKPYKCFKPYLIWAKDQLGTIYVIPGEHSGTQADFIYNKYTSELPASSQAYLCTGFKVLKLGGVTINSIGYWGLRNLDFCNLDYLSIVGGKYVPPRESEIYYSTIRHLTIKDTEAHFKRFVRCSVNDLKVEDSLLHWFTFERSMILRATFTGSRLFDIFLNMSATNLLNFERVTASNLIFVAPKESDLVGMGKIRLCQSNGDANKSLRLLYQVNGMRREAADAYYNERKWETKHLWYSLALSRAIFSYSREYHKVAVYEIGRQLGQAFRFAWGVISFLIWGFGEKPGRIIATALIVIMLYSTLFYLSGIKKVSGEFLNSIYLSIVTFTTLGFGDITPINSSATSKILVASEALLGAFLTGLLVAGYSNKNKY